MKKRSNTILIILVILVIAFVVYSKNQSSPSVPTVSPTQEEHLPLAIKITEADIKEANFTGTKASIAGGGAVADAARKYVDETIADFKSEADTDVPEMRKEFGVDSPSASYSINIDATYVKGSRTESIVLSTYTYTGGAHGNTSYKVFTASLENGKIISLSDIIERGKQNSFTSLVKQKLYSWRPEGSDALVVFEDAVKDLTFNSFSDWSLDDKNLILYFDQYEIGPGVLGEVAFPLSLTEIKDFLNTGYL
jgi:hypothetical protein